MNKAKFFELLATNLKFHNRGADSYRSADFEAQVFSNPRNDAKKPAGWIDYAANIVLGNCWYTTFTTHKTAEAAEKQTAVFVRWLAEWKASHGLEIDIEIDAQEKEQREANVKRLIHCCEHHDVSITRADAEDIVDSFNGAFVLGIAWKQAQAMQTERISKMTMDDLIAAACNADDPNRKAADLEMLHRVGTLSNLIACAHGL